jgi:glutathione peroxidase
MIKILIVSMVWMFQTSIYSYKVQGIHGNIIDFNSFRNKKILLVNISTKSRYSAQLQQLEQLYNQNKDKLVIVAFPSNSFGHEPGSNKTIEAHYRNQAGVHFLIAAPNAVNGAAVQPVYKWLSSATENGVMDGTLLGDFQKFLVNEQGKLVGVFSPEVEPLSAQLVDVIKAE